MDEKVAKAMKTAELYQKLAKLMDRENIVDILAAFIMLISSIMEDQPEPFVMLDNFNHALADQVNRAIKRMAK